MGYTSWLDRLGLHRRELRAWALYDVANSAWITTVMTTVFPIYFVAFAIRAGLSDPVARSRFAFAGSLSMIVMGVFGPVIGAIADFRGSKKTFLGGFVAAGVVSTVAMAVVPPGHWLLMLATFVVAKMAVMSSLAFYNSLLPAVARPDEVDRVSTAGFALGYLGGGALLVINLAMIAAPRRFLLADRDLAIRAAFLSVAVWYALFSIPLFRRVPEPVPRLDEGEWGSENVVRIALQRLVRTFRDLRQYRDAGVHLLAFLVYNDAINTIIAMAAIYGGAIGIPDTAIMATLVVVQFVGVPFSFLFGLLADRIGGKRAIFLALAVYAGICVYAFFLRSATQFMVLGILVGTVQGGAQALARSLFAKMIPPHNAGEMFGFFGVFDRFGGAIGSFVFFVSLTTLGSSRPAILTLVLFFALGALLLSFVDVERGRRVAREAEAAAHDASTAGAA
jgi:UMF1 family MFS transporter